MRWPVASLGDLCQINIGRTPSRSVPAYWEGGIHPWLSISDMGRAKEINKTKEGITDTAINDCNMRAVKPGTVLFSFKLSIGKLGIAAVPLFTNEAIASLPILDRGCLCEEYLFYALQDASGRLVGDRAAMGITLNKASLAQIEIPLPPLEEQRRIAVILDQCASLTAFQELHLSTMRELEGGLLRQLDAEIPGESKTVALSTLVEAGDKINYGVIQPGVHVDAGVPLIRVGDLAAGIVNRSAMKSIDPAIESLYSRSRIRGNEILISCVGSIGIIAEARPEDVGSNIARAVARVPVSKDVNRTWLAAYLRSQRVQRYFTNELRTVSQPTLNIKQIQETEIILPPLGQQQAFAIRLEMVHRKCAQRVHSLQTVKQLANTLATQVFKGEVERR
jgi:type I restriction enzyme S subunit